MGVSVSTLFIKKERSTNRFARQVHGHAMPQRVGYCEIQKEYVPLHQQTQEDFSLSGVAMWLLLLRMS